MTWRRSALAVVLATAANGCGGGGGQPPDARRTHVVPHVFETKGGAARMTLGDLNGDGLPDLLFHDPSSSSVQVVESTGLRESPSRPSTGATKRFARGPGAHAQGGVDHVLVWDSLADLGCGDLDGDGRPDLVLANGPRQTVDVAFGELVEQGGFRYHDWTWFGSTTVSIDADRVAIGDVDGDGRCEVCVLETSTGKSAILVPDPADPRSFVVGNDPPAVGACDGLVLADMDRDGLLDLVTNRPDADAVAIVHGPLLGTATLRESPTRRSTGRCMAVGDVDGDGWLDVVLLEEGGRALVSLHQRPDASRLFDSTSDPVDIAIGEEGVQVANIAVDEGGVHVAGLAIDEPGVHRSGACIGTQGTSSVHRCVMQTGLALADLDLDGVLDVLASPPAGDPDASPIAVYGLRESPTRRFDGAHERLLPIRESPTLPSLGRLLAAGDLDGDGRCDLITGDPDFDLLRLHYTDPRVPPPAPDYQQRARESPTRRSTGRALADLDRDGRQDLVVCGDGGVEVRFRDASQPLGFVPPQTHLQTLDCRCLAVGDLNQDGCPDVVVGVPDGIACLLRDPAVPRAFAALPALPLPGEGVRDLALGDLDGDGLLDVALLRESPTRLSIARGVGDGRFDLLGDVDAGIAEPVAIAVADLDGDGRLDLAICGEAACSVVRQGAPSSGAAWSPPRPLPGMGGVRVAAGDLDGDGRCDVVTTGDEGVLVALQSPFDRGEFRSAYALSREACAGLALRDIDRNGLLDVCYVVVKTGTLTVGTGDPDFDLLRPVSLNGLPPGEPVRRVAVVAGDLDGDGRDDLVVTHELPGPGAIAGEALVFSSTP